MIRIITTKYKIQIVSIVTMICGIVAICIAGSTAPNNFPEKEIISIPKNTSITRAAEILKEKGIIRSVFFYKTYVALMRNVEGIQMGEYLFDTPQSAIKIAYRMSYGIQGVPRIKVTIPEGLASYDIARLLSKNLPSFDEKEFLRLAIPLEGYLFPDTYFFFENIAPEKIIDEMKRNFESRTRSISLKLNFSRTTMKDLIIMASIIEEEASDYDDRRIISGILWKRLESDMALQVDAPFFYIMGKTSHQLTKEDLATTSPYNTYTNRGLPPAPISNPGLDSILAALNPTETKYWFYLADNKGTTHYAIDHDGHVANKRRYLQ